MTVTIVTMFFQLREGRPKDFYMTHAKHVLSIPAPMVVFCDGDTRPDLEALRGDGPTVYVEKRLMDYDYYSTLLPIVRKNRETLPSRDARNTPEYFLLSMFKFHALLIAHQRADFPTSHYMWLDIGASHIVREIPAAIAPILETPRPKIACCYIHYRPPSELYPMRGFLQHGGKCGIAAGLLTVESKYVPRLFASVNSIFYEQLSHGVGHAEEQVLVYCYDRHPEWFSLYFGDYYSLATNYHRPREDTESIRRYFIEPARAVGRHDLAHMPFQKLLVLVISSANEPVYEKHKEVWRSYMNKTPGVDVYFLEMGDTLGIQGDTFVCPGTESLGGILVKTIEALKVFRLQDYDFVLRTNLSSLWNFQRLLNHVSTWPRQGVYAGVSGKHKDKILFVSGSGMLMSPDVCATLLEHEDELRAVGIIDDVDIGAILIKQGISPRPLPRINILALNTPYSTDGIHYRIKMECGDSRDHEPEIMKSILTEWNV